MELNRRRGRETTRKRVINADANVRNDNNNNSDDNDDENFPGDAPSIGARRRRVVGERESSPKRLKTAITVRDKANEVDDGAGNNSNGAWAKRPDEPRREARAKAGYRRYEKQPDEEGDYQAMCSSQGPTSAGVTWDFSSPSPSQYKKYSQKSYAKREEETNRIAEQMKSDGIQSRFLVGNLGRVFEEESRESSTNSIDALAQLNKRIRGANTVPVSQAKSTSSTSTSRSILDEVQRLHDELQQQRARELELSKPKDEDDDDDNENLDSSLGVHPLETSDDDLSTIRRLDPPNRRILSIPGDARPDSTVEGGSLYGREARAAASTSTPSFKTRRPSSSTDNMSPSQRFSPKTPSALNRSFPRPTQSVSPEFPPLEETTRASTPETSAQDVDEATVSGRCSVNGSNVSGDGRDSDNVVQRNGRCARSSNTGNGSKDASASFEDDWSDLDESLFVLKATQAEEAEQARKYNFRRGNADMGCPKRQWNEADDDDNRGDTADDVPISAVASSSSVTVVPATPPSVAKRRKLALTRKRTERRKTNDDPFVDLTLSDGEEGDAKVSDAKTSTVTVESSTVVATTSRAAVTTSTRAVSIAPSTTMTTTTNLGRISHQKSTKNSPLRLKLLRRSFSPRRHASSTSAASTSRTRHHGGDSSSPPPSPIPSLADRDVVAMHSPLAKRDGNGGSSTPPADITGASTSFCFSDAEDVDLSFVEAASQRIEEERSRKDVCRGNDDDGDILRMITDDVVVDTNDVRPGSGTSSLCKRSSDGQTADTSSVVAATTTTKTTTTTSSFPTASDDKRSREDSSRRLNVDFIQSNVETFQTIKRSNPSTKSHVSSATTSLTSSLTKSSAWSDDEDDLDDATLALLIEEVDTPSKSQQNLPATSSISEGAGFSKRACSFPPRPPPDLPKRPLSSFSCSEPSTSSSSTRRETPSTFRSHSSIGCHDSDRVTASQLPAAKMFKSSSFSNTPTINSNNNTPKSTSHSTAPHPGKKSSDTASKASLSSNASASISSGGVARFTKRPASFASVYKPVVTAVPSSTSLTSSSSHATTSITGRSHARSTSGSNSKSGTTSSFRRHQSAAQLTTSRVRTCSGGVKSSRSGSSASSSVTTASSSLSVKDKMSDSLEDIEEDDDDDDDALFAVFRKADEICQAFATSQRK